MSALPRTDGDCLLREDRGSVAWLTLNRPQAFNAIDSALLDRLQAEIDALAARTDIRVVVIAATGKAFSPGHDLKEMMAQRTQDFIGDLFRRCCKVMLGLQGLPQTVIARVQGIATAAGCQLVAGCDLALASNEARFATSGINFGLFCATPGVPLSRNIARKRAYEMLFTGEFIDAQTALDWGLVNRVAAPDQLDAELDRLIGAILEKPAAVCAEGKRVFYAQLETGIQAAYAIAANSITANMLGGDAAEGVAAFIGKRKPRFNR